MKTVALICDMNYYLSANVNFDRFYFAEVCQKGSKPPLIWVLCRNKQKPFLARIPLISTVKQHPIHWGFFTFANCKYVRGNQRNDAIGSAARTSTGGDGGRILEPVRECVSLLSQAFGTTTKTHESLKLPETKDGSDYGTFLGKRNYV